MSSASKSVNIMFIPKMGTFTPSIQSPDGDLYQEYQKNGDVVTVCPDFSQSQPKLYFVVLSSRVADGVTTPVSMKYFFNETEIPFNSSGKSTGLFEIIRPSASQFYWGLKICNNLVKASNYSAINIKMVGKISERSNQQEITDEVQAVYKIPVGPYTGVAYRVSIKAPAIDTHNFVLNNKDDSCQLEAKTTLGNETLTSGLYYKWYRAINSITGWEQIAGANDKTITVKASEVDCTREFMVEVYNDKAMVKENLLGFDFQTVIDASDPYDIEPNPVPVDESISEDEAGNGTVTYTPRMIVRGKSEAVDTRFYFTLKSGSGVVLNTEAARKPTVQLSSFAVTRADCEHAGYSSVVLTIQSVK
jgi:hypothetical protein